MDAGTDTTLGGYLVQQHWRFYMADVLTCAPYAQQGSRRLRRHNRPACLL
jgi:hypothetical protein